MSSKLFGAEGRGIISYGTSIFASFALITSFNLGRGFIVKTARDENLRKQYLFSFLVLNTLAIALTAILGLLFFWISRSADSILEIHQLFPLMATSVFYVWSINGNEIFAALQLTTKQETIILGTRAAIVAFLVIFYLSNSNDVVTFIWWYAGILGAGVVCEWLVLSGYLKGQTVKWSYLLSSLKQSFWPHLDYVSFHLFPLVLILICGLYLDKASIGRVNFSIQIINLIFLLSVTASIRIKSYISSVGFRQRLEVIKKLFKVTLLASIVMAIAAIPAIGFLTSRNSFGSFQGVEDLFKIAIFAIPGYIAYQFLLPLWLEDKLVKKAALLNCTNMIIACAFTPWMINTYHEAGALLCFSIFHMGSLIVQLAMFRTARQLDIVPVAALPKA